MPVTHFGENEVTAMLAIMNVLTDAETLTRVADEDGSDEKYTVSSEVLRSIVDEFDIIDVSDFMTELEEVLPDNLVLNSDADGNYWLGK